MCNCIEVVLIIHVSGIHGLNLYYSRSFGPIVRAASYIAQNTGYGITYIHVYTIGGRCVPCFILAYNFGITL